MPVCRVPYQFHFREVVRSSSYSLFWNSLLKSGQDRVITWRELQLLCTAFLVCRRVTTVRCCYSHVIALVCKNVSNVAMQGISSNQFDTESLDKLTCFTWHKHKKNRTSVWRHLYLSDHLRTTSCCYGHLIWLVRLQWRLWHVHVSLGNWYTCTHTWYWYSDQFQLVWASVNH